MQLINTIVEDAKPGMYVWRNATNIFGIKSDSYKPRDYQKMVKQVYYCYDNGRICPKGIGEVDIIEEAWYDEDREVLDYIDHPSVHDEIRAMNYWLINAFLDEILESIDEGEFEFPKESFAPSFIALIDHLREMDDHDEPVPWNRFGFIYRKNITDEGETWYRICAVVPKSEHHEWKEKD